MTKKLLAHFYFILFSSQLLAQAPIDTKETAIAGYYKLAIQYKDGNGVPMDYKLAYQNFSKAAEMGDPQSIYAIGYLHYKGLGCSQDYNKAAKLFYEGAILGKDNSMYFYGLCWRNGYGVDKNEDSAKFWLNKAAALGYKQAVKELQMSAGENCNDSAAFLVQQINNAAIPNKLALNKYTKIQQRLPPAEVISGNYRGYIIQYDWSGTRVVTSKKLQFMITAKSRELNGRWIEDGTDTVNIHATLAEDLISFKNTQYRRLDHYSPNAAVLYNFENARLNLVQTKDSVFLAGNLEMFSPERKEPSKPLFVALSRQESPVQKIMVKAYPSPFTNILTVDFNLLKPSVVEIQLASINGTVVYRNPAGLLEAGWYTLPIQVGYIANGVYLMKLIYGTNSTVVKVLKQ